MIVDRISELSRFLDEKTFERICSFIKDVYETDYTEGTYVLGDGIYANVTAYELKAEADCMVEVHKHHIDIQATLSGVEGISIFDSQDLEMQCPYDNEKDVSFPVIKNDVPVVRIANIPGYFTLIYPDEPHRPKEAVTNGSKLVKKYVIKIDTEINPQ